ncbi:IS3 family transposase domain protein [Candidatus Bealeia paramacronuclearis]|uniref:IS3 family transposase domain protein n=1 Tax=Candidatus Bealeia paramacronuclearis TaxID=1921001 RepID=A0ABZ2C3K4_9PROT
MRKTHSKDCKFKVALEAIRGDMTIAQIVSKYQVADSLVHKWKKQLLSEGAEIFERGQGPKVMNGSAYVCVSILIQIDRNTAFVSRDDATRVTQFAGEEKR